MKRAIERNWADGIRICIFCPACNSEHCVDKKWEFDGNFEFPTISPSLHLISEKYVCHSFVRDGKIQFLEDSTHKLAGKTVDLPKKYK